MIFGTDQQMIANVICKFYVHNPTNIMLWTGQPISVKINITMHLMKKCDMAIDIANVFPLKISNNAKFANSIGNISAILLQRNHRNLDNGLIFAKEVQEINGLAFRIDQDIRIIDLNTWNVYEQYTIHKIFVFKRLGFIDSSFEFISLSNMNMIERRGDFYGYEVKAVSEMEPPYIYYDLKTANFDRGTELYDITYKTSGMFYDVLKTLENTLNMTTKIYKRKDFGWGNVYKYDNGSIIGTGMINSILNGEAELICARYSSVPNKRIDKVQKMILSVCRALEFSPAQANQVLAERLVRELAPV